MLSKKIAELVPRELGLGSDIYGLQFGNTLKDLNLHKIAICVDPSIKVILQAKKTKSYFIIAHHGLTQRSLIKFNEPVLNQFKLLSANNISLFILSSAWIAASGGISDIISEIAGIIVADRWYVNDNGLKKPLGRVGTPYNQNLTLDILIRSLKRKLNLKYVQVCGKLDINIKKIVVICGISLNEADLFEIVKNNCDTLISTDLVYSHFIFARKLGLNVLNVPHYACDIIAMKKLKMILSLEFPRDEFSFIESENPIILM
ncbi:Nif3-like dinuclear metal center hexameric protein [Promethearchaeum syntrophicum]|uniref:Nif3-like dinuclear metal center hexameric protein n=1 Tax=Promethearchaeum syntrophicum TaxID=2594042 RepID=A0A5B9D754_9ARCH|nr:Nif3-like dinuclear metal center hexameric protein [Candidatus Prometheoarchaeum syntrophicum]QEE14892.1 NIF3 (NGG1p interacting factor 3) [Candidatus Prometheoarchaeum syntrophicum]